MDGLNKLKWMTPGCAIIEGGETIECRETG